MHGKRIYFFRLGTMFATLIMIKCIKTINKYNKKGKQKE